MSARFFVLAVGPLSNANIPAIEGMESFGGEVYHTAHWPHQGVDFTGQRVGVIGTGSSGIQAIPCIAQQASQLYVFQRSPNYSVPAGNVPLDDDARRAQKARYPERRRLSMASGGGSPHQPHPRSALDVSEQERREAYEKRWQLGGVLFSKTFPDQMLDAESNDTARAFWEEKIRAVVDDPQVADWLIPTDHPIGTKRICTDDNYFQTFNRENVALVNLRETPIVRMDSGGLATSAAYYDLDALVLATGFDAMTGSVGKLNIVGRGGETLNAGVDVRPGHLSRAGCSRLPEPVQHQRPGQPIGPGQHGVAFRVARRLDRRRDRLPARTRSHSLGSHPIGGRRLDRRMYPPGRGRPYAAGEFVVSGHEECAGKPPVFMPFVGGFGVYGQIIADIAAAGYKGFDLVSGRSSTPSR